MMWKFLISVSLILVLVFGQLAAASPGDLLAAGRVDEAIASLQARTKNSPNDAEAYILLARAYYAERDWDRAVEMAERAVALQPNNGEYHLWLGRTYGLKAENSSWLTASRLAGKVRSEFERAVQLMPNNVRARSDLAEFYFEAPGIVGGGTDKARAQAAELMKLDPASAHWVLGRIAEKKKNYSEAEREFRAAIEVNLAAAERWIDLAGFYRRRHDYDKMQQTVDKAIEATQKAPRPPVLYDAAAMLFGAGRNLDMAARLLREYIHSNMHSEEAPVFAAYYLLGQILEKQGDRRAAAEQYRAALALASRYDRARSALKRVQ